MRRVTAALAAVTLAVGLLAGCSSSPSRPAAPVDAPAQVRTTSGELRGLVGATARQFLGIRYAAPPTGARRWTDPEAPPAATGVVDATKAGSPCPQAATGGTGSTDEDCLFLNVTTPRQLRPGERLPVMVWWHGGGFTTGAGSAYDAQRLASNGDVVVVTVNYRLGILGYLGLPGLAGSGDFGLADQILATRWAKDNAAAFGGDPGNITVFGESAGAMSACALLTSPAAAGLVDEVAMSSGSCGLSWPAGGLLYGTPAQTPYVPLADSTSLGTTTAAGLGCTGADAVDCLRALPLATLMTVNEQFSDVLAYDTDLLPEDPADAAREGRVASVPVISGGNQHEESAFVGGVEQALPGTYSATTYPALVATAYPDHAADVLARYPATGAVTPAAAFADLVTDAAWACPTLRTNADLAAHGSPVYAYEFRPSANPNVNGVTIPDVPQAGAHATDVPYLFDLLGRDLLTTPAMRTLSERMIGYWTSFARTGTPEVDGGPAWPRLTGTDGPTLGLGDTVAPVDVGTEHACEFWAGVTG